MRLHARSGLLICISLVCVLACVPGAGRASSPIASEPFYLGALLGEDLTQDRRFFGIRRIRLAAAPWLVVPACTPHCQTLAEIELPAFSVAIPPVPTRSIGRYSEPAFARRAMPGAVHRDVPRSVARLPVDTSPQPDRPKPRAAVTPTRGPFLDIRSSFRRRTAGNITPSAPAPVPIPPAAPLMLVSLVFLHWRGTRP